MRIEVRFKDNVAIMDLSGKFIAGSDGPFLRQKVKDLMEAGSRKLVFDFSDVPYIDSTGLGFLAGSREAAQEVGARIVLAGLNEHVKRILDGVKLSQFFEIAGDEAEALIRLNQVAGLSEAAGPAAKPSKTKKRPATLGE